MTGRLRAERRAGQLLAEMPKAGGVKNQLKGKKSSGGHIVVPPEETAPTLDSLGISKNESSWWQKLAAVPEGKQADVAMASFFRDVGPWRDLTGAGDGVVTPRTK